MNVAGNDLIIMIRTGFTGYLASLTQRKIVSSLFHVPFFTADFRYFCTAGAASEAEAAVDATEIN
jgi:hypothetical protein